MPFVDFSAIRGERVPKPFARELKIALSPDMHADVSGFSLIVSTLDPEGGCTDTHAHETSGELMICMTGAGKAWLAGTEHELKPGVAFYAPPGVPHRTLNSGSEPLTLACVFVPAVPDDYIRKSIEAARKNGESG
jgi:mannose-6-phosphate isomerase-like protein (cupin superfamily)